MSVRHIARPVALRTALIVSLMLGLDVTAFAQNATTVHGVANVGIGYTDNMLGSPSEPAPDQPGPVSVWLLDLSPGIRLIHESPRALFTLTYSHPFTFYLGHWDATQHSDAGVFTSIFSLSPQDELTLGLAAYRSDVRLAALHSMPTQTVGTPQLTGRNLMLQANLTQGYSHEYTSQWRIAQRADFGTVLPLRVPTPQTHRYSFLLGAGPEYTLAHDALGFDIDGTYYYTTEVNEGGVFAESVAQVVLAGTFRWRHDLNDTWSTLASVGMAGALRADPFHNVGLWGPTASASIRYNDEGYEAALTVQRSLGPDLITATTVMADHVLLTAGLPISREHNVVFQAGGGFSHSRSLRVAEAGFLATPPFATPKVNKNAQLVTTFNSFAADASVGWYPLDILTFDLRFSHVRQVGVENQIAPAATFHRSLIMLNAGVMWPARDVPPVPPRDPTRVDGADRDSRIPGASIEGAPSRRFTGAGGD